MDAHDRPVFYRRCDNEVMDGLLFDELPSSFLMEQIKKVFELIMGWRSLPSNCGG